MTKQIAEFKWTIAPSTQIGTNAGRYAVAVADAIKRAFDSIARKVRSYAVKNRRWIDRTSNAKNGLRAIVEVTGAVFTLYLIHTMPYGIWLELANAGRYAIILRTLEAHYPLLMQEINDVLKDVPL